MGSFFVVPTAIDRKLHLSVREVAEHLHVQVTGSP